MSGKDPVEWVGEDLMRSVLNRGARYAAKTRSVEEVVRGDISLLRRTGIVPVSRPSPVESAVSKGWRRAASLPRKEVECQRGFPVALTRPTWSAEEEECDAQIGEEEARLASLQHAEEETKRVHGCGECSGECRERQDLKTFLLSCACYEDVDSLTFLFEPGFEEKRWITYLCRARPNIETLTFRFEGEERVCKPREELEVDEIGNVAPGTREYDVTFNVVTREAEAFVVEGVADGLAANTTLTSLVVSGDISEADSTLR